MSSAAYQPVQKQFPKATETDPKKMNDSMLEQFIKYQYHRTAHAYEQLDYAIRLSMRGETPDHSIRSYRLEWVKQYDRLQAALDEKATRAISMR